VLFAMMYHQEIAIPAVLDGVKTVLLDARAPGSDLPCVVPDEHGGAMAAVGELVNAGHRRIGFATEALPVPAAGGRLDGYTQALMSAGVAFDPDLVVPEHGDTASGYRAALRLLRLPNPPTAIFCYNDRMAMGCYRAAAELGLRIPDDLSVVGYDDQDLIAPELFPALTTVALPHYEMGVWAARRLLDLIEDTPREDESLHLMPCPLVRRNSVGPPSR
jgi:LacI family transcriptional regulator